MDDLLKSFGEDAPSGENLEYESVFTEMEMAAQPGEERQMGDEVIAAEEPDDRVILEKARAVLEQSHDLRAAILIVRSELRLNGYEGFAKATTYVRGCLEQFWATCHPQLDEEDDDDPTMRVNAVLGLCDDTTVLRALRNAPLTHSNAFGRVTLRDIFVAEGEVAADPDADRVLDAASISAAFQDTDPATLLQISQSATTALEDVRAIDAVFNERLPGQGPDLNPVMKLLFRVTKRLSEETGVPDAAAEGDAGKQGEGGGDPVAAPVPTGAITTRHDVEMAIDRILKYYATHEPSSPLPILLNRAKRLVGADFITIMKDIAPSGVDNVMLVGGIEKDE